MTPPTAVRARIRRALLGAIAVLYVVSIPWYRGAGEAPTLLLGLPGWVTVSLVCYVAAAVLNAAAWLLTDVADAPPPGEDRAP